MGRKPAGEATAFSAAVARIIDEHRTESGMSVDALVKEAGMGRNTYFVRMRGDMPFNLNEIDAIATALGLTPQLVLTKAASEAASNVTDIAAKRVDQMTTEEIERERSVANIDPAADTDEHQDT